MVPLKTHYFGGSAWLIQYNIIQSIHVKCPVTCWENGYFPWISTIDSNLLSVDDHRLQNTRLLRHRTAVRTWQKTPFPNNNWKMACEVANKKHGPTRWPISHCGPQFLGSYWLIADSFFLNIRWKNGIQSLDFIHTSPCSNRYLTLNPVDLFEQRLPQNLMAMIWATCIQYPVFLLSTPMWRPHNTPLILDCWFSIPLYKQLHPHKWLGIVLPLLLSKSHHWWYPSIDFWWTARNIIDHLCLNTHQIVGGYVTFRIPMYLPFVHILSTIFPHFRFYRLWITSTLW